MRSTRADGLYLLILGAAILVSISVCLGNFGNVWMEDFRGIYFSARSLEGHLDPYSPSNVLRTYAAEQKLGPSDPAFNGQRQAVSVCVYPPATFLLILPLTLWGWLIGHWLWMLLSTASLIIAACLVWSLAADYAAIISGILVASILVNSFDILLSGNAAGIAVALCIIAVWCFTQQRFGLAGVLCLAVSLAIKPHDAGLIWLLFLAMGGIYRKRSLQALIICAVLNVFGILWVSRIAPAWYSELFSNLAFASGRYGRDNPGPSSLSTHTTGVIVDLQTVFSMFRDAPRFYNSASYLLCGLLLLPLFVITARTVLSQKMIWLALGSLAPLSMLPTYHRVYDAKLLLLTIPACALLQTEGQLTKWAALAVSATGIVFTSDLALALFFAWTKDFSLPDTLWKRILTLPLTRPVPLALFTVGIFYLFLFLRQAVVDGRRSRAIIDQAVDVPVPIRSDLEPSARKTLDFQFEDCE